MMAVTRAQDRRPLRYQDLHIISERNGAGVHTRRERPTREPRRRHVLDDWCHPFADGTSCNVESTALTFSPLIEMPRLWEFGRDSITVHSVRSRRTNAAPRSDARVPSLLR